MLVLTRKQDESIVIDGRITVRILRLKGNSVRVGIDAPADVHIRRGELGEKLPDEKSRFSTWEPLGAMSATPSGV